MDLSRLFDLEPHGPDTFVGSGPRYPWGGLYGGQIVAQALRAAATTVEPAFEVHSLRAYFIRRGEPAEPIRYEVDRIRNGRTFVTRRVVARQAIGAILNLEASFQTPEASIDTSAAALPAGVPAVDALADTSWTESFARRVVPADQLAAGERLGIGRMAAWMKVGCEVGDDDLLQRCWLAYLSDDLPCDTVTAAHRRTTQQDDDGGRFSVSLDHTIWFHRPGRADRWHLHDVSCVSFVGGRGLTVGHIFGEDGTHVATIAQEALMRGPA